MSTLLHSIHLIQVGHLMIFCREIIDYILGLEDVQPEEVTKGRFQQLRRECFPAQNREIRRRVREERGTLQQAGREMRAERKRVNKERKRERARERAVNRNKKGKKI